MTAPVEDIEADLIEVVNVRTVLEVLTPPRDANALLEVQVGGPMGPPGPLGPLGPPGPQGVQGTQGPPGAEYSYRFAVPSIRWVINHQLGTNPTVTVLDFYDVEFSADVSYPDKDTVVIDFALPFAGTARLRA